MRLLAALLLFVVMPVQAQYPDRSVHLVVPFPAGGPTDVLTRVVAQKLGDLWSKPVIVDNKPGAGGAIGLQFEDNCAPQD
jgi:tripartite-type tricarboxylate transporter receptor subunit TctC